MTAFKLGEVVILCNAIVDYVLNGREATIIETGVEFIDANLQDAIGYRLDILHPRAGVPVVARKDQIRRKSPPASTADERECQALMDRLMNRKEQTA